MFGNDVVSKPKRVELDPPTSMDLDLVKIASEAESVLGYRRFKSALSRNALALVLRDLEIDPFDREQVKQYKEKKRITELRNYKAQNQYVGVAKWELLPLYVYNQDVPEFVLAKALDIKEKLPTAEFYIDQLRIDEVYVDPFLVVKDGEEMFWIEVWDEPEFECI
jgi:hypothetical protein